MPHFLNEADFGKKAMAADIEEVAFVLSGPRDSPDDRIFFEHKGVNLVLHQFMGGCEPGRAPADDNDWPRSNANGT